MTSIDPVDLTAKLVRCPSVTPADGGAQQVLYDLLTDAGFDCAWADRGGIKNLFARWGKQGNTRSFGFNGHTDVVPIGNEADWTMPPFGAEIKDGIMYGRGTTDMKSGVAAFTAAAIDFVRDTPPDGSIVLAITGDEEAEGIDGTRALLDYMKDAGERMDVCLVGEPTCPNSMGEMIKIGRRGSLNAHFRVIGKQGHAAYPHRANNPMPAMMRLMDQLASHTLDEGTDHFDPSTLAIVTVDTGNPATNVIPAETRATVNIRFNDMHSGDSLTTWLEEQAAAIRDSFGVQIELKVKISGESFITPPGDLSDLVSKAVQAETGVTPELSTSGGTSDARFMKHHCPVVEFGLVGQSMHEVDENVEVAQIHQLKSIYTRILKDYFA
ncbi:MAG: succinyl-diaminopimelate desuccinylase [Sulfitobacter litoralis]|mgnify:FL=1|jgi:succinyl-diaminopimelate desuccinylase|uniref:Succinyl-diaminopimelate desuccinylase n=1 Tax=Sulfitobacter litoralis TaxID=335975 RepID=A0ABY0RV80_9RHOB|nr:MULTISPECIES: succinyl-diaminopimelate desuccinylase [Sulfitobacter]MBQ0717308.1 succinyl-diaminopimelate desuccinylase [Sulfitobacter litoralis]MBQ0766074.1 succinyl-diaminopimelate desuccinylase [Sulfitobacter litoralis]MBQ0800911.1 succinyl-diaminopimelate desuccinylase [Sulfitobacter litoralis]MCF7727525.1 succinyl-diaminopimelate desuccinylase [Sulfitobacter sp. M22]MCF7778886.1 succinyl-diaminopimelate desuccinylase [Sulfitobacter sp. M220]|tara:strand:- start:5800 stop:6945 length:1146 start_codon:yes stop_codon:yes gene_type:complete